jgi:hypothetical protein
VVGLSTASPPWRERSHTYRGISNQHNGSRATRRRHHSSRTSRGSNRIVNAHAVIKEELGAKLCDLRQALGKEAGTTDVLVMAAAIACLWMGRMAAIRSARGIVLVRSRLKTLADL